MTDSPDRSLFQKNALSIIGIKSLPLGQFFYIEMSKMDKKKGEGYTSSQPNKSNHKWENKEETDSVH